MEVGIISIHPLGSVVGRNGEASVEVEGCSGLSGARSSPEYKNGCLEVAGLSSRALVGMEGLVVSDDISKVGIGQGPDVFSIVESALAFVKVGSGSRLSRGQRFVGDGGEVSMSENSVHLIRVSLVFVRTVMTRFSWCAFGTFEMGTR